LLSITADSALLLISTDGAVADHLV
jgi:hypothetical protein